ncbi:helix-turn-helix domain-containing protein [Amycolatopsis sp. NPDC005003]
MDELLGIDSSDPKDALADELVKADFAWVDQLVNLRKRLGLSQTQVAEAMGRSQSVVSDIETMSSDPRLSTLRRYALAIGVAVKHRVFPSNLARSVIRAERPEGITARTAEAGASHASRATAVHVTGLGHVQVGVR